MRINQLIEKLQMFVVWHLLPRKIVMWAAVRVAAHATQGQYENTVAPELTAMDALKRWDY